MDFVDKQDVLDRGDCIEVAKSLLGLKVEDDRCAATWRNGTNPKSVALTKDGWYDHSKKEGGSVIDLVMKVRNCNFVDSLEELAKFYNIERKLKIAEGRKKIKEFTYNDAQGNPLHKSVRYQLADGEKDFIQYRFENNDWCLGLGNIETVPYHLDKIKDFDTLFIHEGEGKCDCAIEHGITNSTCFCLGSGKWFPYWGAYFKDKDVIIVRDNDDAGYAHGARLAWELKTIAKSIKLITPSKITKGDCYEYFNEEKGTTETFLALVSGTPTLDIREIHEPKEAQQDKVKVSAKEANKTPFANYTVVHEKKADGTDSSYKVARSVKEMLDDLNVRLMGFPRRVGSVMFDRDHKTGEIRYLNSAVDFTSWVNEKTGHNTKWGKIEGVVTAEHLFSSVYSNCQKYTMISGVPHYPVRNDVYYAHGTLPEATSDAHYFNKFCSFFCPAKFVDSLLIKLAIASPLFFDDAISKPMFVIDSDVGRGIGKSKFVEMLCQLYGDPFNPETFSPIDILPETLGNDNNIDKVFRRLLSSAARQKRIIRIDNATGYFKSDVISMICTSSYVNGMSPYARGEEARANDMSIFITSNQAHLSGDFVSRGFLVHLTKPSGKIRDWEYKIKDYIKAHRYNIIADIIGLLSNPMPFIIQNYMLDSRFKAWEDKVMIPLLNNESEYQTIWEETGIRRTEADGELFEAELIKEALEDCIREQYTRMYGEYDPAAPVWINSNVLNYICQKAIPGIGGKTGRGLRHILKDAMVSGKLEELFDKPTLFPSDHKVKRQRGIMWDAQGVFKEAYLKKRHETLDIKIIKFESDHLTISKEQ